jgi:hypothetical protein
MLANNNHIPRYVEITHLVFEDDEHRYMECDPYIEEVGSLTVGQLYRRMQEHFGRCIGHVHIDDGDSENGTRANVRTIGWIYVKRVQYEDRFRTGYTERRGKKDFYLRETWVTVLANKPRKIVEYDYVEVK